MTTPDNLLITDDDQLTALGALLDARPTRQPGWVDAGQIMARHNLTRGQVIRQMEELTKAGKAEAALVYDPQAKHMVRVWRVV